MITTVAIFSDCGKYRYQLARIWNENKMPMCIGLNPSTANSEKPDATIRLLSKVLKSKGYGGLRMVNLYALISSKPERLAQVSDPQNGNKEYILELAKNVEDVIFCWGTLKGIEYHAKQMIQAYPNALCFGKNANGSPVHPLQIMYSGTKDEDVQLSRYQ